MHLHIDDIGFTEGALYNRRSHIHARFGGQRQGGISTPRDSPYIFIFTGASGAGHGYFDFVDDAGCLHYYGEGQAGDMQWKGGNRAILTHAESNRRLFVFRTLGKGKPCRYFGEFRYISHYQQSGVPDTAGALRTAIIFVLEPINDELARAEYLPPNQYPFISAPASVTRDAIVQVRTGQRIFRKRLELIEPACRITGISDARYLRASHIKPWAKCETKEEKIDGFNGLLLTPNADHLFDKGYISFKDSGELLVAATVPTETLEKLCARARQGRNFGAFQQHQLKYLEFHRDVVFNSMP